MTKKIFKSILFVGGAVLVASLSIIMGVLYQYFSNVQENALKDELNIAVAIVQDSGQSFLEQLDLKQYRVTWIAEDGTVLYDTQTGAEAVENHADREEVQEALESGEGESIRYSATRMEKTMYYARRIQDGSVLRISVSSATVGLLLIGMIQPVLIVLIVALILSGILASRLSKRIVEPLNHLDLEHPLENDTYEELAPLLGRINRQHQQISSQLRELQQKTDEFTQITANMSEGLVLLDENGTILSINPAAQRLFSADSEQVGKDFLTVDRNYDMSLAIEKAMDEGHSEIRGERDGREYQFDISRIESAGNIIGAVLLAFDVTEQAFAERNRREFTANVSHELKTPLQGIIGSVELIENGMVKPEDMPRFIGHIRTEASRLVVLIEDIIRLSQLDEGKELPIEKTDLFLVAEEVMSNLTDAANQKNVTLLLNGDCTWMLGVRRLLYEIIYNLCDNAIKYNVEGGKVEVTVASDENTSSITVKDSGIGIPAEHQNRIFERFYRVDKSHSKASGGTGLGLSIVKHAVQLHRGKIELDSTPGKGTQMRVVFPKIIS
jgi:two-component system phosphate regulon sensor histidine kinase PhoR